MDSPPVRVGDGGRDAEAAARVEREPGGGRGPVAGEAVAVDRPVGREAGGPQHLQSLLLRVADVQHQRQLEAQRQLHLATGCGGGVGWFHPDLPLVRHVVLL